MPYEALYSYLVQLGVVLQGDEATDCYLIFQ